MSIARLIALLLLGLAVVDFPGALAQPAPGHPAPSATPPQLAPLDDVFVRAATTLFDSVPSDAGEVTIVIDPLVDGVTGIQSRATRDFDSRIEAFVAERYPRIKVLPFTPENAVRATYIFIGTFNTINNAGQPTGTRDAYWICFALIDREAEAVFVRAVGRATLGNAPLAPTAFYADAPVWGLDAATVAYIEACQRSRPGAPVDPAYLTQLPAAARIREATAAYEAGDHRRALSLYREVEAMPGGDQLRVLNGIYLAQKALAETADAQATFARLVDAGLELGRLGIVFLFQAGSTAFNSDARVSADYPSWLGAIARRTEENDACLQIKGHASRTGSSRINDPLSLRRAERIIALMREAEPAIAERVTAAGVGSREVLVGLVRDDASTAVDRRVEFRPVPCA